MSPTFRYGSPVSEGASGRQCRLVMEQLETRRFLSAGPMITEFMSSNSDTLLDGYGDSADWIEVYNQSSKYVDLTDGYYLSDDPANQRRWKFPNDASSQLGPGEYLVVFASGRDEADPEGNLHSNFRLRREGEYLSLAREDGSGELTVLSEFDSKQSTYPTQRTDIAFGVPYDELISSGTSVDAVVATADIDERFGESWRGGDESTFQARGGTAGWQSGTWGVGTRTTNGLESYRRIVTDEPSLISLYTFDNDNDGPEGIKDVAGTGTHHGRAIGTVAFADGVRGAGGKSLSLDGQGYVSLGPVSDFFFPDGSLTLEAWLQPTFGHDNRSQYWVGDELSPAWFGAGTLRQGLERYTVKIDANYQGVITTSDSGSHFAITDLTRHEWIHVVSVIDGNSIHQYVNGQLVESHEFPGIGSSPLLSRIYLGTSGLAQRQHHFVGQIDELAIYEDALSSDMVRRHYESFALANDGRFLGNDLTSQMVGISGSAYARSTFAIENTAHVSSLLMDVQYSDGYVAHMNGVEVARRNAPETLDHQSLALAGDIRLKTDSLRIAGNLDFLRQGDNVLTLHAMNSSVNAGGLIVWPRLTAILLDTKPSFLTAATPGGPNAEGFVGFADEPTFDIERGVFEQPLSVKITAPMGSSLVFTTNGDEPTISNGTFVESSPDQPAVTTVHVDSGLTVVRAASVLPGHMPSRTVTNSYFVFDSSDVTSQLGLPQLVANEHPATIVDALTAIPSISLAVNEELMFGSKGIHTTFLRSGREFEVPVSVEYVDPLSQQQFQIDAGVRIHGDATRDHSKKQFRLFFRPTYGEPELSFPIFDDSTVDNFHTLILRSGGHDSISFSQFGSLIRDPFLRQTQIEMGQPSARSRYVHLYINGEYRGIYYPTERPDADFAASHLGGTADEWDSLNAGEIVDGNGDFWNQVTDVVKAGPADDNAYTSMQQLVDVTNFIDDMILRYWSGDGDWFGTDNYYVIANRNGGRFKFLAWDAEVSMGASLSDIRTDVRVNTLMERPFGSPGRLLFWLSKNHEFKIEFGDRLQKHLFGSGVMAVKNMTARWDEFVDLIDGPMVLETARHGTPDSLQRWHDEVTWVRNNWLPNRNRYVLEDFQRMDLYAQINAPVILLNGSPHFGGKAATTDEVIVADPEGVQVVYTTDGTDPRAVGGGVSQGATMAQPGTVLTVGDGLRLRARVLHDNTWSALVEADFLVELPPADADSLRVTEVHFNPAPPTDEELAAGSENDDFEFIEFTNISSQTIDLTDIRLSQIEVDGSEQGVDFHFSDGEVHSLAPGQRVVVVEDVPAFRARYGHNALIAGQWRGRLSNGGERISVFSGEKLVQQFTYDDAWYEAADGAGRSLVVVDVAADLSTWNRADGWRASAQVGGSPAAEEPSAGDANQDGQFDQFDIVLVLQAARYRTGGPASWEEGDWNGDGVFDQLDIVIALQTGSFLASAHTANSREELVLTEFGRKGFSHGRNVPDQELTESLRANSRWNESFDSYPFDRHLA